MYKNIIKYNKIYDFIIMPKRRKQNKTQSQKHKGGEYNPHNMFLRPNDVSNYTIKTPGINDDYHKIGILKF